MFYLNLKPGHEKERAVRFFKSFSVDSMQKGKQILYDISKDQPYTSLNNFLIAAGEEPVKGGEYWGWKNLYWELISNKYGVAAIYNQKTKGTSFVFRLPPIEDIHEEVEREIARLKKERDKLDAQGSQRKQQEDIVREMRGVAYTMPSPSCFRPVFPPCYMYEPGGGDRP